MEAQKTPQPTLPLPVSEHCSVCQLEVTGIQVDGFLLPTWILKQDSAKELPHGPRLYRYSDRHCWHCASKEGQTWHR